MESTTLVTFLYQASRHATTVELLGSWDNFSKPYAMQKDKSVSSYSWKGCHSFSDIVCDGDVLAMDGSTREGGLRMGGTYWYYYRLDDEVECHDPTVQSTRGCPFLPGQEVNVLEVPVQETIIVTGSSISLLDCFTLDPSAKFTSPKQCEFPEDVKLLSPVKSALSRATSLRNSFLSTMPKFSLARSRSTPNRRCCTAPSNINNGPKTLRVRPFSAMPIEQRKSTIIPKPETNTIEGLPEEVQADLPEQISHDFPAGSCYLNLDDDLSSIYSRDTSLANFAEEDESILRELTKNTTIESVRPKSIRTSGFYSMLTDSAIGSPRSTNRHSDLSAVQPLTPSLPLFDSFVLEPLKLDLPGWNDMTESNRFMDHDYSTPYLQPEKENLSEATIQRSIHSFKDLNHTARLSPMEKLDMVASWRIGESPSTVPETEPSALQELINDLGYLSCMID